MSLDYYYMDISPPCAAVNLCIATLGIQVNRKHINLFERENLDAVYVKMNPQHTIPMIVDDGFVLWDSHAINMYLVSKYAKDDSLYPKDLIKRALVDQRLYFEASALFPLGRNSVFPLFLKMKKDIPGENIEQMLAYYEMIDKFLEGSKWIAGDQMTIADFSFISFLSRMQGVIPGVHQYKNITDWMDLCKSTMVDFETANQKGAFQYVEILTDQMNG